MFRHVLPNAIAPVLVSMAFGIASAILTESGLSFLGIGVPAQLVTWGSLLAVAQSTPSAWWLAVFPGAAIFVTVLAYALLGDALRDALDPRERGT
jgi:peptide/nickel transport system permease protein